MKGSADRLAPFAWFLVAALTGCGGGGSSNLAPQPDFSVAASPASVSAEVGATTSPVTITVTAQNGFTGSLGIMLQGIPPGVTASPSSSFSLTPDTKQSVTFNLPDSAMVGSSAISVVATSGTLAHTAQFTLTADAIVHTYQSGSMLFLESGTATDTSRIGLETMWGGSIVEVSANGTNYVNRHDTGREVQPAFRDGNDPNWNPTLGGDIYDRGTPTQALSFDASSLYTKAVPLQWSPDFYGGEADRPVPGDVLVEQTITAVTDHPHTFKAHYKVTHLGNDLHTNTVQEFPAVYANQDYNRFVYYGGTSSWTNGAVTVTQFPDLPQFSPVLYVPEHWGALVDSQNVGLTIYVPSQYPYVMGFAAPDPGPGGPTDNATNAFAPSSPRTLVPGLVFEGDIYLIAGDYITARQIVYELHQNLKASDIFPPAGATDTPSPGSMITGVTTVAGWTFDDVMVSKVEIIVDGAADGVASYGSPRADIPAAFPNAPLDCGFSYSLDTTKYRNGPHTLNVRVTDINGNIAVFSNVAVIISN
jgi:hypothetical protein